MMLPHCLHPHNRYVLSYIESHVGLRRGEKIWQMGFGSGFKCNSAVWRARRRIKQVSVPSCQTLARSLVRLSPKASLLGAQVKDGGGVLNGLTAALMQVFAPTMLLR